LKIDIIFDVTAGRCNIKETILWSFVNVFMMGKLSNEDKMRIQTLSEQGLGAKAIRASYPDKNWSLSTLQTICRLVDETGSAVTRRAGRG